MTSAGLRAVAPTYLICHKAVLKYRLIKPLTNVFEAFLRAVVRCVVAKAYAY